MQYTAIIEKEPNTDWGAYVPDLPGCVAVGASREEVERLIQEAVELHLRAMREDGEPIPAPNSMALIVEVAAQRNQNRMGERSVRYTIVIENAGNNYSAYVPDFPGCIATGKTIEETKRNMQDAIAFHLRGMREDGEPIPQPNSTADVVEVAA